MQDCRVAVIGIILEDAGASTAVNAVLHEYADCIIGRMGLPYRARRINVISLVVDAPQPVISALSGKLGMIPEVTAKAVYSKAGERP